MRKILLAGIGGAVAGVVVSTQFAAPLVAQEAEKEKPVYQELDFFGDIFERIRHLLRRARRRQGADRERDQRHADASRSAFELHAARRLRRHEGADQGRVRRFGIEVTQENGFVKVVTPIEGTRPTAPVRAAGRPHRAGERRERQRA